MSARGLLRMAWRELWQRPGLLLLAFWNVLLTSLVEYFFMSRLGPQIQPWLTRIGSSGSGLSGLWAMPSTLWVKIGLVNLTMLLIVLPFTLGGLYGGVSAALGHGDRLQGFFRFFHFAVENFWRSLAVMVGMLVVAGVIGLLAGAIALGLGLLAQSAAVSTLLAILAVALTLGLAFLALALVLYWLGAVYYGRTGVARALGAAIGWLRHDWWLGLRVALMLFFGVILPALVVNGLATLVPVLGGLVSLVAEGVVMGMLATVAVLLNREVDRHQILPPL
ncbi:MAG: hypothetical protein K6U14_00985 [Firmicutes bacterium]|nr:hypothetical protein [Alicyclobacillaceae bacterium]MCL6496193.1 hypothetical protein [Bacillota bacterium]